MTPNQRVGQSVLKARKDAKLTQVQLAEKVSAKLKRRWQTNTINNMLPALEKRGELPPDHVYSGILNVLGIGTCPTKNQDTLKLPQPDPASTPNINPSGEFVRSKDAPNQAAGMGVDQAYDLFLEFEKSKNCPTEYIKGVLDRLKEKYPGVPPTSAIIERLTTSRHVLNIIGTNDLKVSPKTFAMLVEDQLAVDENEELFE
jgi:hypothetical protein